MANICINFANTLSLLLLTVPLFQRPIMDAIEAAEKYTTANNAFQLLRGKHNGNQNLLVSTHISIKSTNAATLQIAKTNVAMLHCTRKDSPDASN